MEKLNRKDKARGKKLSEYTVLIRKVRKTKRGVDVIMSLCRIEGDKPFLVDFKFTGKVCKELLSKKGLITVRASVTENKIGLKSITFIRCIKSKIEERTYPLM